MASGWICVHGDVGYAAGRACEVDRFWCGECFGPSWHGHERRIVVRHRQLWRWLVAPEPGSKAGMRGEMSSSWAM